jgi:hypothetical protein
MEFFLEHLDFEHCDKVPFLLFNKEIFHKIKTITYFKLNKNNKKNKKHSKKMKKKNK